MKKIKTLSFIIRFYLIYFKVKLLTLYYRIIKPSSDIKKDVYYLEVFTIDGAGFNYRVKKWMDAFKLNGLNVEFGVLIENSKDFFEQTRPENLQHFIIQSMKTRIKQIKYSRQFKTVIVRRSILLYNNYGNLFFEKLISSAHPNCILDIDDDTSSPLTISKNRFQQFMQENNHQFYESFNYYKGFIAGSNYLKELILSKNAAIDTDSILVVPTCVDYTELPPKKHDSSITKPLQFGWIGGNHNLPLLKSIIPALNEISMRHNIELRIIAGVNSYPLDAIFPVHFIQYNLHTEIEELLKIDIGLMPLNNSLTDKGKCGFKLLQYMGLGIPGIASAVTVNNEIIEDSLNGWLVQHPEDWEQVIQKAINARSSLYEIGLNARTTVDEKYAYKAHLNHYLKFLAKFSD